MFGSLGLPELLVIFLVVLLVFGAGRLPEVGRSLGKAISEFKKGMQEGTEEKKDKSSEDKK